jgi:H+-transporting ATPase
MIIINETIRSDLIVFIALFADLATVAVAYDNAHSEARPVEWQLPKIWIISVILGIELALATWVIRATMYIPNGGIVQNWGNVQEILFLEVALTENWLIFVTRGAATFPSWQLIGAIAGVDAMATLFCIFGWLSGGIHQAPLPDPNSQWWYKQTGNGHTDVVTAIVIWAYSIGVIIVIAITYYLLNQIPTLNDLGRKNRNVHDTQMENILGHLSKLAIKHEKDEHGESRWTLITKSTEEADED